jgi:hypothetical protein
MENDRFERAKARLERAWNEAEHRLSRRHFNERVQVVGNGIELAKAAKSLGEVFDGLSTSPCADCRRCCTQAAFSSGFHTHAERESILASTDVRGNPLDYVVAAWPDTDTEPPERCLFLTPSGCNLPVDLRSAQCTSYVCYDKLGPALHNQGLEPEYKKARGKHSRALRVLQDGLGDVGFEAVVGSLGDG